VENKLSDRLETCHAYGYPGFFSMQKCEEIFNLLDWHGPCIDKEVKMIVAERQRPQKEHPFGTEEARP
jgi:hypothetical protein